MDTNTLLEWLTQGTVRDLHEMALEQLCGILLMTDDLGNCLRMVPPKSFLPALFKIFLDEASPINVLEITARAITYYLDLKLSWITNFVSEEEGVLSSMCNRLVISPDRSNLGLVEQCIKALEFICVNGSKLHIKVEGFNSVLTFIANHGNVVHKDVLYSATSMILNACQTVKPTDFPTLCWKDLSALLIYKDELVVYKAIKSFIAATDTLPLFYVDTTPIAKNGVVKELLTCLITMIDSYGANVQDLPSNVTDPRITAVTDIFSLLTRLCRSSPLIIQELLQSNFYHVIPNILNLNETNALNLMEFLDSFLHQLLINAKVEAVVPKEGSFFDIIEFMRLDDYDGFKNYLETTPVDINCTNNSGQTLVNWASAIGIYEMVELLFRKCADVNKGEQGSSLHYAASVGNFETARFLIHNGANIFLKDNRGKTPITKAEEGDSDGHREITKALSIAIRSRTFKEKPKQLIFESEIELKAIQDNFNMSPAYIQRLLPILCTAFQSATFDSTRKAILKSIQRIVQNVKSIQQTLKEFCESGAVGQNFVTHLTEIIFNIVSDENDPNLLMTLEIIECLMGKSQELFLDTFARLGILHEVQNLARPIEEAESLETVGILEDATEILPQTAYHWHHWCICLGSDAFYAWNDSATFEFCYNSNGWFRFYVNGQLHCMYSCGRVESISLNPLTFLIKFDAARRAVKNASASTPILSRPGSKSLVVNNWSLTSPVKSELHIKNIEILIQKTTLRDDLHGFWQKTSKGAKNSYGTRRSVVPKDASFWLKVSDYVKVNREMERNKKNQLLANLINKKYFKSAKIQTRPILVNLKNVVVQIKLACEKQNSDEALKNALYEFVQVLINKEKLSLYELGNSGIVQALLLLFEKKNRIQLLKQCFETNSTNQMNTYAILVQILITMLENTEQFPTYLSNFSDPSRGLQDLRQTFKVSLEREAGEDELIDRTKQAFEVEPLVTIKELEDFIFEKVRKKKVCGAPKKTQSEEAVNAGTSALESDALPDLAVSSGSSTGLNLAGVAESRQIFNLDTPTSESGSVSELHHGWVKVVKLNTSASGSNVVDLNAPTSESKKQHKKTILERILTTITDGKPNSLRFRTPKATSSSEEVYNSDSSEEDDIETTWDRRLVLKADIPSMLPAFDPAPGRSNINPTTNFEVLPPGVEEFIVNSKRDSQSERKLRLTLKTYLKEGRSEVDVEAELELSDRSCTIFQAMQELFHKYKFDQSLKARVTLLQTHKIVYRKLKDGDLLPKPNSITTSSINDILQLLKHLFAITTSKSHLSALRILSPDQFFSTKINYKILQQIKDPMSGSTLSIPDWCDELIHSFQFLIPIKTRQLYFQMTAFGVSRSILWFQAQNDIAAERARATNRPNIHFPSNFQFGRLKIERVRVPRGDTFFEWVMQIMKIHSDRKSKLESQFVNEEGTGLGPTLEFYALAAAEFQRRDLGMWICDDGDFVNTEDVNVSEGTKAPNYYVRNKSGLFPAPLLQNSKMCDQAVKYFWVLGVLLAKVLQDSRLIDLPLSDSFLKLMCYRNIKTTVDEHNPWYHSVLRLHDLHDIDPVRAKFLKEIRQLIKQKNDILQDDSLCDELKTSRIQNLKLSHTSGPISLKDLALNFTYAPSSKIFGISAMELVPDGANIDVTVENIDEYYDLTLSFALEKGIGRQLNAFHDGFSEVFPIKKLATFSASELKLIMTGDQNLQWTKEDILNNTEPKLGYCRESPGFLRFVNVLLKISPEEKKAFLQFTTGCSSLPPGGLANLQPRLTVVKKFKAGEGAYPSVNTCVHYLKLPDYSTEEILKKRLLEAIKETGFDFN